MADDGRSTNSSLIGCVPPLVTSPRWRIRGPYPGTGPSLHSAQPIPNRLGLRGRN